FPLHASELALSRPPDGGEAGRGPALRAARQPALGPSPGWPHGAQAAGKQGRAAPGARGHFSYRATRASRAGRAAGGSGPEPVTARRTALPLASLVRRSVTAFIEAREPAT